MTPLRRSLIWIRIRIKVESWIRIRIKEKCLIRILIKVMRIRNPGTVPTIHTILQEKHLVTVLAVHDDEQLGQFVLWSFYMNLYKKKVPSYDSIPLCI